MGYDFMAISAGPLFSINPSISFHVKCETEEEVDEIWKKLLVGGTVLMELGTYPFSKRYGWIQDAYGVSWQIMYTEGDLGQRIIPMFMFTQNVCGKAEEAMAFYASIFPASSSKVLSRYIQGELPEKEGTVKYGQLILVHREFGVMDSAHPHDFTFNEGISFVVTCKDQEEIDFYWKKLSAVPEAEQCGWLKDKYGVSWQIIPVSMGEFLTTNEAVQTMLKMKKIIIADLQHSFLQK